MIKQEAYGEVDLELLREMSEAHGISGCEKEVSRVMKKWMEPYCDEITYDNLGSIIGLQKGEEDGPKVMIAGHLDEVGFMVREIDEQGYIRLLPVGGWWGHVMPSQMFYITTQEGKRYRGVIGTSAPHGLPKEVKEKVIKPIDMFLDLGVENRQEVIDMGIQIGDMITPDTKMEVMNNPNLLLGKAWDDRLCACAAVDVLKQIHGVAHAANVYAVGTMQEEVGLRGARTAADQIHPDVAIALDVTTAKDTPVDKGDIKLGKGVVLSIMDAGIIGHKALLKEMETICHDLQLDVNYDMMTAGGTDADNIHKAHDGVVCMTLSIPTRYMHSHRLIIHRRDYVQTVQAIAEFCRRINKQKLAQMKADIR